MSEWAVHPKGVWKKVDGNWEKRTAYRLDGKVFALDGDKTIDLGQGGTAQRPSEMTPMGDPSNYQIDELPGATGTPASQSPVTQSLPLAGSVVGSLAKAGGPVTAAAGTFAGGTAGELLRQGISSEPLDLVGAVDYGAKEAALDLGAGKLFDAMGWAFKRLFNIADKSNADTALIQYAKENNLKLPPSAHGRGAATAEKGARMLLPGDSQVLKSAEEIAGTMNREIADLRRMTASQGTSFEAAVDMLKGMTDTDAAIGVIEKATKTLDPEMVVPTGNYQATLRSALDELDKLGTPPEVVEKLTRQGKRLLDGGSYTASQLDTLRLNVRDTLSGVKGNKAKGLVDALDTAMLDDIQPALERVGYEGVAADNFRGAMKALSERHALVDSMPNIEKLSQGGTNANAWLRKFFNSPEVAQAVAAQQPELYQNLVAARLDNLFELSIDKNGIIDGRALRTKLLQDEGALDMLTLIPRGTDGLNPGASKQALLNFTKYLEAVKPAMELARKGFEPGMTAGRAAAEGSALLFQPQFAIPAEGLSYWVGKSLYDPGSRFYTMFADGIFTPVDKLLRKAGIQSTTEQVARQALRTGAVMGGDAIEERGPISFMERMLKQPQR